LLRERICQEGLVGNTLFTTTATSPVSARFLRRIGAIEIAGEGLGVAAVGDLGIHLANRFTLRDSVAGDHPEILEDKDLIPLEDHLTRDQPIRSLPPWNRRRFARP